MIRSVNIFDNTTRDKQYPIRIEFWDNDKLVKMREVKIIFQELVNEIESFIKCNDGIFY